MGSIQLYGHNIDISQVMYLKKKLEADKRDDPSFFGKWHGTTDVEKAFINDLNEYLIGAHKTNEFRVEAKIKSGELEIYPFIDRTTKDGYVVVDNFELDDYHANFLVIGNEFRVVKNDVTMKSLILERSINDFLGEE